MIATKKRAVASSALRVAIYARKSVADAPDQEFGSIEAQREVCSAFIERQRDAGWTELSERYDDEGFTGANTDRPAFKRLLHDIDAKKVDVVIVYRIDRLSRSMLDISQLLVAFDRHEVSFVSVTESFDTTTPAGRMFLHLLATFAQYERETIAERVRDKVHASRLRGMWTGGPPPLGYDLVEKRLVVNAEEAERVREVFALYREIGALMPTARELNARGWTKKSWTTKDGRLISGRTWTNTSLYSFLTNPLLIGKMRAGTDLVDGQHDAIVDQATFDAVQARLALRAPVPRGWRRPKRDGALLAGLLKCACGASMTRSSTRRRARKYSSYVCVRVLKHGAAACRGSRASAGALEQFVIDQVRVAGRDPRVLQATLEADRAARDERRPELEAAVQRMAQERGQTESEGRNVEDAITRGATSMVGRLRKLEAQLAEADQNLAGARCDLKALDAGAIDVDELQRALTEFEPLWALLSTPERARVLALLLERVTFHAESGDVEIKFRPGAPRLLSTSTCLVAGAVPANGQANHSDSKEIRSNGKDVR